MLTRKWQQFRDRKLTGADKIGIRRLYDESIKETEDVGAQMANDVHTGWYRTHGVQVEIK